MTRDQENFLYALANIIESYGVTIEEDYDATLLVMNGEVFCSLASDCDADSIRKYISNFSSFPRETK